MALIPTHTVTIAGTAPTPTAAASGDTARVGAHRFLYVINGSGSSITVTIVYPGTLPSGDAIPDKAYTVAAGASGWIPLLEQYADPTTGQAAVNYSSTTTVTRVVVQA